MVVDRIGHIDPIQPEKKPGRVEPARGSDRTDSINLSSEALEKAEIYQVVELIKSAPEIGEERIAELRAKINNPSYVNEELINAAADKIMDAFGL
ncbi:MAG: flagellar biosynthesis anti-sigma factor FlgM [Treponema sp.]|jgi:negative regulator of flagellin synthesis FlgM|nr:flagellar biosynthesis anti-sigma factor FlgM [Treponema sp.]